MNKETIFSDLQLVFRSVFNAEQLIISPNTSQGNIDLWDSLNHAILIEKVEKQFDVKFDLMDMLGMQTAGEICDKIFEKKENR
ncbi:MAG: acyl carrier protein [Saprospiraceae bacterium]|jgi:acyl carrier protein